jgi:hypothetical protein
VRLEEGLRRLQLNQTISSLERLEAEHSDENEEINFRRLSQLLQQVRHSCLKHTLTLFRLPVSIDKRSVESGGSCDQNRETRVRLTGDR